MNLDNSLLIISKIIKKEVFGNIIEVYDSTDETDDIIVSINILLLYCKKGKDYG